jgi:predicted transposase YbfD/YdcC
MNTTQEHLQILFSRLEDPRVERTKKHPFLSIVFIAMCAALAGVDDWIGIEDYAHAHADFLAQHIELPHGVPSHDTFSRVLGRLDVDAFSACFMEFTALLRGALAGVIAIDGKTLRGSADNKSGLRALHSVSAWSSGDRLVLGQVLTSGKSNEITAIPKLLSLLDISGQTITIDAMGCQKDIAAHVTAKGGNYVLALKGNQGSLHEDIALFFEEQIRQNFVYFNGRHYEETDSGHGRIEIRRCFATADIAWLVERHPSGRAWPPSPWSKPAAIPAAKLPRSGDSISPACPLMPHTSLPASAAIGESKTRSTGRSMSHAAKMNHESERATPRPLWPCSGDGRSISYNQTAKKSRCAENKNASP